MSPRLQCTNLSHSVWEMANPKAKQLMFMTSHCCQHIQIWIKYTICGCQLLTKKPLTCLFVYFHHRDNISSVIFPFSTKSCHTFYRHHACVCVCVIPGWPISPLFCHSHPHPHERLESVRRSEHRRMGGRGGWIEGRNKEQRGVQRREMVEPCRD